jgi:methionyl-tRNA synthetase
MPKEFYITTAIDYTNSAPHIGHAYEKILADVIARYHRLKGEKVFFLTGVDQHGQKVQQSAAKEGVPPAEFVKGVTQKFVDLWEKLDVKYDAWAETTSELHKRVVQGMLQRLFDEKQIYKDKQAGHYSIRQEQFLTDRERGPGGEFGPEWGQVEFREEENYYFKLNQYKGWLLQYIEQRKDAVIPDYRQLELRNAVEKLSGDLCISRPKSRLDWGIELPFDKDFVTYVWFDALSNYISFAGYDPKVTTFAEQPSVFRDKWPALQVIGKDILIPAHGIYWLAMLHALGFPDDQVPQLLVHGWWNLSGAKISKSAGNVVDPSALADNYGSDALRYYLMSDIAMGKDADFSEERLITRYNNDLANSLGNLLNRTLNMLHRYSTAKIIKKHTQQEVIDLTFCPEFAWPKAVSEFRQRMDNNECSLALKEVESMSTFCDMFTDSNKPWVMAKDPPKAPLLGAVLYELTESLRIIAILISPVLPKAAHGIFDQLNWKMEPELSGKEERFHLDDAKWGGLPDGHVVGKPVPLFPRIETT